MSDRRPPLAMALPPDGPRPEVFPPGFVPPGTPPPDRRPSEPLVAPPSTFIPAGAPGFDVRERLFEQRRILITGCLDDELATRTAAELMLLDATGDDAIELHVSCSDAELTAANALADTIDLVGVAVRAVCLGGVGGAAIGSFTAADHRVASPSAVFHLRNPRVRSTGSAADLDAFAEGHRRELEALHRRIAVATGQTVERIRSDFDAGTVLDADEARRYGIVHEVRRATPAPVTRLHPPAP